jgi:predicted O-methyltransferase YrrM
MRFRKIIALIILLAVFFISLDFISLTDKWRFFGWEMFYKKDSELYPWPKSLKIRPSTSSAKSGQGSFPNSPYVFTKLWFFFHIAEWENHLKELKGKPNIHALEIGSYEGFSAIWQLENILTDFASTITCIDIFDDKVIEDRFDQNIKATGVSNKVIKLKGPSEKMLRGLNLGQYNYIYIDGCHLSKWVLSDAVLSWDLLNKGGLMIFDDYGYIEEKPPQFSPTKIDFLDIYIWKKQMKDTHSPMPAIDAFLKIYGPYLEVVFKRLQVVVKKL